MSTVILPPPLPPQQQQAPEMTHPGRRSPTSVGGSACHRGLAHSRSIPKIHHHQYHSPPAAEAAADFHHHQFALDFTKWKKALLLLITTTTAQDNINVPLQPKKEHATGNEEEDSGDQEAEDQCSAVHPLGLDVLNSIIDSLSVDSLRDRLKALVVPAQKLMDGLQSTRTERSEQQQQQSASPSPPAPRQFYSRVHPPSVVPTHISNNNNNISSGGNGSRLLQSTIGAQRLTTNDSSSLLNYGVVEVKPMFAILDNNSPVITKPLLVTTGGGGDSANSSTTTGGRIEPYGAFLNTLTATVGDRQGGDDESWELNQYLMLELLGQGSQGCVYLGYDNVGNEFRAIKEIKRPLAVSAAMTQIKSEVDIMKRLRHRNLISLYELIDDPKAQYMYLVMRYAEKGILVKYTNAEQTECETVELSKVQYYAKQLLSALAYLHNHDIYHRDIKPENVLCGRDDEVYLADFGVAQMLGAAGLETSGNIGSVVGTHSPTASMRSVGGYLSKASPEQVQIDVGKQQPTPRRVDSKYTSNSHSINSTSDNTTTNSSASIRSRTMGYPESSAATSSSVGVHQGEAGGGPQHAVTTGNELSLRSDGSVGGVSTGSVQSASILVPVGDQLVASPVNFHDHSPAPPMLPNTDGKNTILGGGSNNNCAPHPRPPQISTLDANGTSHFASTRGTPAYFSPELAAGIIPECDLDLAAVDVWALGVTLYQLLCGKLPFSTAEKTNHGQSPCRAQHLIDEALLSVTSQGESDGDDRQLTNFFSPNQSVGDDFLVSTSVNRLNAFEQSVEYLDNLLHDDLCPIDTAKVPKEWEKILRGMLHKDPDRRMTVQEVRARLKAMDHTKGKHSKQTETTMPPVKSKVGNATLITEVLIPSTNGGFERRRRSRSLSSSGGSGSSASSLIDSSLSSGNGAQEEGSRSTLAETLQPSPPACSKRENNHHHQSGSGGGGSHPTGGSAKEQEEVLPAMAPVVVVATRHPSIGSKRSSLAVPLTEDKSRTFPHVPLVANQSSSSSSSGPPQPGTTPSSSRDLREHHGGLGYHHRHALPGEDVDDDTDENDPPSFSSRWGSPAIDSAVVSTYLDHPLRSEECEVQSTDEDDEDAEEDRIAGVKVVRREHQGDRNSAQFSLPLSPSPSPSSPPQDRANSAGKLREVVSFHRDKTTTE